MTRPLKNGLEYFSLDIDIESDKRIEYIEAKYGIIGFALYIKLLIKIYHAGYYFHWSDKEALILSKQNNVDINTLSAGVIDYINEGLFNRNIYDKYSVLTSNRIQKQYVMALARRKEIILHNEFLLINRDDDLLKQKNIAFRQLSMVNVDNNSCSEGHNVDNNSCSEGHNVDNNPQSKVKEKESKEKVKENIKDSLVATEKIATTGIEIKLSEFLYSFILSRNGNHKAPSIKQWAKHIDLMIRIDKRDPQQIKEVIQWCQEDEFWQNNILSTKKLRVQYDQLLLKMMAFYNKQAKKNKPIWYDSLKSWYDKKMEEMADE